MNFVTDWAQGLADFGGALGDRLGLAVDVARASNQNLDRKVFGKRIAEGFQENVAKPVEVGFDKGINALNVPVNAVDRLLATPLQVAYLARKRGFAETGELGSAEEWRQIFSGDTWSTAWDRAGKPYTAGQSFADAFLVSGFNTKDQLNFVSKSEQDMQKFRKTDNAYNIQSGALDFAKVWYLDPLNVVGRAAGAIRIAHVKSPIARGADIAAEVEGTGRTATRWASIKRNAPHWDTYQTYLGVDGLRESTQGMGIASAINKASRIEDAAERDKQMNLIGRVVYGDQSAKAELATANSEIMDQIAAVQKQTVDLMQANKWQEIGPGKFRYWDKPDVQDVYKERLSNLKDLETRLTREQDRLDQLALIGRQPIRDRTLRVTTGSRSRAVRRGESEFRVAARELGSESNPFKVTTIRHSLWNLPVKLVTAPFRMADALVEMAPRGYLNLHDPGSVEVLDAMLKQQRDFPAEARSKLLSRFADARGEGEKMNVLHAAETQVFAHIARKYGLESEAVSKLVNQYQMARMTFKDRAKLYAGIGDLQSYSAAPGRGAAEGRTADVLIDEDGSVVRMPLMATHLANDVPVLNTAMVEHVVRRNVNKFQALSEWTKRADNAFNRTLAGSAVGATSRQIDRTRWGFQELGNDALNLFNRIWKFGVLFRLGYPLRNVTDEQMRIASSLESGLTQMYLDGIWNTSRNFGRFATGVNYRAARDAHQADLDRFNELEKQIATVRSDRGLLPGIRAELKDLNKRYAKTLPDTTVRNADGSLKRVYHGTNAPFKRFSDKRIPQGGGAYGKGIYFTENPAYAGTYVNDGKSGGNVQMAYLDLRKPWDWDKDLVPYGDVEAMAKELGINPPKGAGGAAGYTLNDLQREFRVRAETDPVKLLAKYKRQVDEIDTAARDYRDAKAELDIANSKALKGSVVRNDDGSLKRVYHGTTVPFENFDDAMTSDASWYGKGHYFTEDPDYSQTYVGDEEGGHLRMAYLDIKNPWKWDTDEIPAEEVAKIFKHFGHLPPKNPWGERLEDGTRPREFSKPTYRMGDVKSLLHVGNVDQSELYNYELKDYRARHANWVSERKRGSYAGDEPTPPDPEDFRGVEVDDWNRFVEKWLKGRGYDGIRHTEYVTGPFGESFFYKDEGGAPSWVAFSSKQIHDVFVKRPSADELTNLETRVKVLDGRRNQPKPDVKDLADVSLEKFNDVVRNYLEAKGYDGIKYMEQTIGQYADDAFQGMLDATGRPTGAPSYVVFGAKQVHVPYQADDGKVLLSRSDDLETKQARIESQVSGLAALLDEHKELGRKLAYAEKHGFRKVYKPAKFRSGERDITLPDGTVIKGAFGDEDAELRRYLAGANGYVQNQVKLGENNSYAQMQAGGDWRDVQPGEPGHVEAWLGGVNKQIRQDEMGQLVLAGESDATIKNWLTKTPDGKAYAKRLPFHASNVDDWIANVRSHVESYLPTPELRATALQRQIRGDDIQGLLDTNMAPAVNGPSLDFAMGSGPVAHTFNKVMNGAMRLLGDLPAERLSRHPMYAALYQQRAMQEADHLLADPGRALLTHKKADALDAEDLAQIKEVAHAYALKEMKGTLYDLSAHSNLAQTMRFLSPFMGAWQETLGRWWNIAKDKPQILNYFQLGWQLPNKLGLVVDRDGQPVNESEGITDDEFLVLRLPGWAGGTPLKIFDSVPYIPKSAFNLALQGDPWWLPGVGPLVQIPVGYLQTQVPDLDAAVKFINPFGPPKDALDALSPATLKRFRSWHEGTAAKDYGEDTARIYAQMWAEHEKSGTDEPWDKNKAWKEAERRTKDLYMLKIWNNFLNPFPANFRSPVQFYKDSYHMLQAQGRAEGRDASWADEQFYDKHPEYFLLARSLSKNNAGLDPTAEAVKAYKKYRNLVDEHPEYISQIVGDHPGDLNSSAYAYQLGAQYIPGSTQTMRSLKNPREAMDDNMAAGGWIQYNKLSDGLDAIANARGLDSHREAKDLMAIKKIAVEQLAKQNPTWYGRYKASSSAGNFDQQLPELQALSQDKRLAGDATRTDIKTLQRYLAIRKAFSAILAARAAVGEPAGPTAKANRGLMMLYATAVRKLVESDTKFSANWFNGKLEFDPYLLDLTATDEAAA